MPRLRFNSDRTVSVVDWGCADMENVLVEVPSQRGRYLFTHPCVLVVPCPSCHAEIGEPCKKQQTGDGYGCMTHFPRRDLYKDAKLKGVCSFRAWQ